MGDEGLKEVVGQAQEGMDKALEAFRREMGGIRAGRASPALLERIRIDYYGTATPLQQVASITTPEARLLVIQPWDRSMVTAIEKAILKSDLGLVPQSDGAVLRLNIPPLTTERRAELTRMIRKIAEEQRVAVRNQRREAHRRAERLAKDGLASEDAVRRAMEDLQKRTDRVIEHLDSVLQAKEAEIAEV